ncbi:centromere protein N [Brachionichthys hirsutus]|uniref:centromere protein N n=1 Tax=Brachionichthys hirsutus TaxID=412623 RepID=UPI003604AC19
MDDSVKRLLQRLVRRIPAQMLRATFEKWGRLTASQQRTVNASQPKWALAEALLEIGEENGWTVKDITELEMSYIMDYPNQGTWYVFQFMDPEDDADTVEFIKFKESFKYHLKDLTITVSIKIKKHTDDAVWIRIAWGDDFSPPNHLKPTYVVHYLQTPYVFVTNMTTKQKPLLFQALVLSARYQVMNDANLSGRKFTAVRDLLMKQYQQVFPNKYPSPLAERDESVSNPLVEREHVEAATKRLQMACEAFGDGMLPQLQTSVYKLETKFKDHTNKTMLEREKPFRCVVKFASANLLESLRSCASSGIASTPVTPLLASIILKGRNYFVIKDNITGPCDQTRQPRD